MSENLLLSARGINKNFGATRALIDVDVDIRLGEIRGLIGENGSGKSTFSSIVAGAQKEDSGTFQLRGKEYHPKSMVDAQSQGVSMIIQEMGTIGGITVAANIFAGRLEQFAKMGLLNWSKINAEADRVLADIGAPEIKGSMMIDALNFEDRKIVEIARAMSTNPDLLIIDETTTALATKGRRLIYALIKRMHEENKAVLFISHDLDELMEVCNTITVLRDGVIIDTLDKDNMSIELMRKLMVGRELAGSYYRDDFDGSCSDEVILKADHISLRNGFENVDITLHKGEILGFSGLMGAGRTETARALFGADPKESGDIYVNGKKVEIHSPQDAVRNGIGYLSEDRKRYGIVVGKTVAENSTLASLKDFVKGLFIDKRKENEATQKYIDRLNTKTPSVDQLVVNLSGGNQQKVCLAKAFALEPKFLFVSEPTRGIDIGAKALVLNALKKFNRESGVTVVMISSELEELRQICDRIAIVSGGRIAGIRPASEPSEEFGLLMVSMVK